VLALLSIQLVYGAFMAGLKAANVAPTWPGINGSIFPAELLQQNFLHHPINVHYVHRTMAFILFITILVWFRKCRLIKDSALFTRYTIVPLILVFAQVVLGILSVLNATHVTRNGLGVFEYLALFHQIIAMCLVMSFVWVIYLVSEKAENKA